MAGIHPQIALISASALYCYITRVHEVGQGTFMAGYLQEARTWSPPFTLNPG